MTNSPYGFGNDDIEPMPSKFNHISEYLTENERILRNFHDNVIADVRAGKWDGHLDERFKCR